MNGARRGRNQAAILYKKVLCNNSKVINAAKDIQTNITSQMGVGAVPVGGGGGSAQK